MDRLLDVSMYNGTIDWQRVRAAGVAGALIRVSVDDQAADPYWTYNWQQAGAAGLARIAYLYGKPDCSFGNGMTQADHLLAIMDGDLTDRDGLALVLGGRTGDLTGFVRAVGEWWERERPGCRRVLVGHNSAVSRCDTPAIAQLFDLWLEDEREQPRSWSRAVARRTSGTAWCPGVSGHVGTSLWDGSVAEWLGAGCGKTADITSASVTPCGGHVLAQSGETMQQIAWRHGVAIADLRAANPQIAGREPAAREVVWLPGALVPDKPSNATVYVVQRDGETLATIGRAFGRLSRPGRGARTLAMERANPAADTFRAGELCWIPPNPTHANTHPITQPPAPVPAVVAETLHGVARALDEAYLGEPVGVPQLWDVA